MKRTLSTLVAAVVIALTIGAVGAPVAAASPANVMFIHGIPGPAVELCVNNVELKGNFKYGRKLPAEIAPGRTKIVIKEKAAGVCRGTTIAKLKTTLKEGDDLTMVPTIIAGTPGFRVFDNQALFGMTATPAAPAAALIVSHAATTGALDAYVAQVIVPGASLPTLGGIRRGKQKGIFAEPAFLSVWQAKTGTDATVFGPVNKEAKAQKVNHYVAIGTNSGTRRLVFFRRPFPTI